MEFLEHDLLVNFLAKKKKKIFREVKHSILPGRRIKRTKQPVKRLAVARVRISRGFGYGRSRTIEWDNACPATTEQAGA